MFALSKQDGSVSFPLNYRANCIHHASKVFLVVGGALHGMIVRGIIIDGDIVT